VAIAQFVRTCRKDDASVVFADGQGPRPHAAAGFEAAQEPARLSHADFGPEFTPDG
jgi:hypothetical protein